MQQLFTLHELEVSLGNSIKRLRLLKNIDRKTLCEQAGISINALKHLESGAGTSVKTLLLAVRVLGRADWVTSLAPQISINPLHMVRNKPTRTRASRRKIIK